MKHEKKNNLKTFGKKIEMDLCKVKDMLYSESPECQTKDGKPVKRYRDPLKTIEKMIKLAEKFQHDMYNVVFTSDFRDYPAEYKKRVY